MLTKKIDSGEKAIRGIRRARRAGGRYLPLLAVPLMLAACGQPAAPETEHRQLYDVVLQGGRVIDPETGLDGVRHIGIVADRIIAISDAPVQGNTVIDAAGLVVAPGFIDLHSHSPTAPGQRYQAMDGVTTALDLEAGAYPVEALDSHLNGQALINYGASVSHLAVRLLVKQDISKPHLLSDIDFVAARPTITEPATLEELEDMREHLDRGLTDGGLGVGLLLDYLSSAVRRQELDMVFAVAAAHDAPVFVHVRRGPPGDATGLAEMISLAREHATSVHICHLNASAMGGVADFLDMIAEARAAGIDITTEAYPWNAGSTSISAAIFDRDWQSIFDIDYDDVEWAETGERFTEETWKEYRQKYPGGTVVHHYGREEWTRQAIAAEGVIIASDAMPLSAPGDRVHPRGIGTFARVLGTYVTDDLPLAELLSKMTLLPAQRLEAVAPIFSRKGRIQVGMDADITVFDPEVVNSAATYRDPLQASLGIAYVLIGGQLVVEKGAVVDGVYPGKLLKGTSN